MKKKNNARGIRSHMNNIRKYLWLHLVLMLAASMIIWFPVFFILYGGIQAVVMLCLLKKRSSDTMTVIMKRFIYIFFLMEVGYTVALLYVGAYALCDVCGLGILAWDCMKGTMFTNSEFFHIMPGLYLSALYLPVMLIWSIVYALKRATE